MVDVPLLDAGEAVGVGAGEDHVGPALQAHDALRVSALCYNRVINTTSLGANNVQIQSQSMQWMQDVRQDCYSMYRVKLLKKMMKDLESGIMEWLCEI